MEQINLTETQRKALLKLWFIYGNDGAKHTYHNHRYIQNILEHGEDTEQFYREADRAALAEIKSNPEEYHQGYSHIELTDECVNAVKEILNKK